ncbi:MAG: carboxypeptidase-like regulatory domain-containing protein [Chloroflexota bacterium]
MMVFSTTLLSALTAFLLVAACQSASDEPGAPPPMESGIEGIVTISPVRPGPIRAGDSTTEQPYQATLTLLTPDGLVVAQIQSGLDGRFRIVLPPGEYILRPESPGRLPRSVEQPVRVIEGQFTSVNVSYDSGLR